MQWAENFEMSLPHFLGRSDRASREHFGTMVSTHIKRNGWVGPYKKVKIFLVFAFYCKLLRLNLLRHARLD
jgi:hypothetical protein